MALGAKEKVLYNDYVALKNAVDSFRTTAGASALSWTYASGQGQLATANTVNELTTNIENIKNIVNTGANNCTSHRNGHTITSNTSQKTADNSNWGHNSGDHSGAYGSNESGYNGYNNSDCSYNGYTSCGNYTGDWYHNRSVG